MRMTHVKAGTNGRVLSFPKPHERAKRASMERKIGTLVVILGCILGAMMPPSVEHFLGLDLQRQSYYDMINEWIADASNTR